jgi:hypothetical protein
MNEQGWTTQISIIATHHANVLGFLFHFLRDLVQHCGCTPACSSYTRGGLNVCLLLWGRFRSHRGLLCSGVAHKPACLLISVFEVLDKPAQPLVTITFAAVKNGMYEMRVMCIRRAGNALVIVYGARLVVVDYVKQRLKIYISENDADVL